jgi:integrase/recombinase XerD
LPNQIPSVDVAIAGAGQACSSSSCRVKNAMLTAYRRHKTNCSHRSEGRSYRRCSCPIWVDGIFDGTEIRQSLRVRTWEDAEREIEKLKQRFTQGSVPADGPVTLKRAWDDFLSDAQARNLRDASLRKYRYLRTDMERFAETAGLRFVQEFDLEQLRKWRSTWPNKNLSAVKKLEFVRCFLRFSHDAGWISENPARKLKSPKVTAHPTMPFSRAEMVQILAAADDYGRPGSVNRRRMKALVLLLRYSGLRIGDAVTLSSERLDKDKLFLYTSKAGTPVYCPLPPFVITALDAASEPNQRFYFWTGSSKVNTITGDWQGKLKTLFDQAKVPTGHAHRFRDTFATELLLAGVPLERVSILLGHSSIRITERHYSPWVRSRQEQLERDVRSTWTVSEPVAEGTSEVHGGSTRPN